MQEQLGSQQAADFSPRLTRCALAVVLAVSAGLLTKQILATRISTSDACAFHLPQARAWATGDMARTQRIMAPPFYPFVVGGVLRLASAGKEPVERTAQVISGLCVLGLVCCVYAIGATLFNRRIGFAAAALTAVNPQIIRYGANAGPEAMYAMLLASIILLLVFYRRRARLRTAVGIGLCAALAGLTRSEGIFMPPAAMGIMALLDLTRRPCRLGQAGLGLAIVVAAAALIWWPRMAYVQSRTGYFVPDIRLVSVFLPDDRIDPKWWWGPTTKEWVRFARPGESLSPYPDTWLKKSNLRHDLMEAQDSILMVITPVTLLLAVIWFAFRKHLPRNGAGQIIVGAVLAAEVVTMARVGMNTRFMTTVAGPAQLWGALGLVTLAERLAGSKGKPAVLGKSLPAQILATSLLLGGLACWAVLTPPVTYRNVALRTVGDLVRRQGPGKVVMAGSPEPAFYAEAEQVGVSGPPKGAPGLTEDQVRDLCRRNGVDYIVLRPPERWAPALLERALGGDLPLGALVRKAGSGDTAAFLIDARRLYPQ